MTTTEKAKKISNLISKVFEESLKDSNQELISKLAKDLNTCKHTAKTTLKLSTIIIESVEKKGKQKGVYTLVTLEQLQNFVPSGVVLEQVFFSDFENQSDGTVNALTDGVVDCSGKLLQSIMAARVVSKAKSGMDHAKWKSLSNRIHLQKDKSLKDLQAELLKVL